MERLCTGFFGGARSRQVGSDGLCQAAGSLFSVLEDQRESLQEQGSEERIKTVGWHCLAEVARTIRRQLCCCWETVVQLLRSRTGILADLHGLEVLPTPVMLCQE